MKMKDLFARFLPYYKKYKWIIVFDLLCASLTTVCDLVFPIIVRYITNTAFDNPASLTIILIIKMAALYFALRLLDAAANFYMQNTGHVMGAKMETDMRRDLFGHLQKLSFSFYSNHKIGQIMSRITSDLFDITEFAHHGPEELFIAGLKLILSFAILSSASPSLTLIVFAVIPFVFIFIKFYNKKMRKVFKEQRVQVGEINSQVEDSLLGIRVVKSFANEEIEKKKFEDGNVKYLKLKKKTYFYMGGFGSVNRFFEGIMYLTVVVAGSVFLTKGKITPGDFTAYLLYVSALFASVKTLIQFTEQFQRGMTGIERFCEIMDTPAEITEKEDAVELKHVRGEIEFKNVTFHYSDDNSEVLSGINLKIPEGGSVAVVGPSGGGKTTLCNLIPRFYDVTDGSILLDGRDIRDFTLKSLRSAIGVVQQEVYLFSGTVLENIEYGRPGASRDSIIEAAKAAGAHEFIMQLPNGYDTYVGERGVKLSGGQKQRISIARVFLKNPRVLILDEATSALDNESERIVQASLERLAKGRTVLTIAHRLTTVKNADTIIVLTDEGIMEQGSHKELVETGGIYSKLYSMYDSI
ncbi:MAG: ABC transporter ATP-binding protein [Oscillospiraceae bacterium]|nr:ABC transporter ATP-binding protein [Oscillospiraceae bacterium]